jgi:hypothetical protein
MKSLSFPANPLAVDFNPGDLDGPVVFTPTAGIPRPYEDRNVCRAFSATGKVPERRGIRAANLCGALRFRSVRGLAWLIAPPG